MKLRSRFARRSRKYAPRSFQIEWLEHRCAPAATNPFALSGLSGGDGSTGFAINGIASSDKSGFSVSNAGDINGDGFDDMILGAPYASPNGASSGQSYVVFGKTGGFSGSLELSTLNGTTGFKINGIAAGDQSGQSVSGAGDVNGDGFTDVIIGAPIASPNGAGSGQSYVVFGKADWSASATFELSTLNGSNGFKVNGILAADVAGHSVSGAGDINGDGFDDVIIGAPRADPNGSNSGQSYVVFGKANWSASATFELSTLNGTNGFTLNGSATGDKAGYSVSGAGDVNGDGFADVIIGAYNANANDSGQSYVVFGKSDWSTTPTITQSALTGSNGFTLNGVAASDSSGISVSGAGDVNGDGFEDMLVGAAIADPNGDKSGQSYLVYGQADWSATPTLSLSSLNGTTGFRFNGAAAGDYAGWSVSHTGDVNGDGFDDLIIGAQFADAGPSDNGQSYVIFGGATHLAALDTAGGATANGVIELSAMNGDDGFRLTGVSFADRSGISVSHAGDINGDGFDDLMIGAPFADPNIAAESGQSYVIFGGNFTSSVTHSGSSAGETLTGDANANVIVAGQAADTLLGNGGADVLYGAQGDDLIAISNATFQRVAGGRGLDALQLNGSGLTLDLRAIRDPKITGIETIDITGTGANTLKISLREVLNLSNTSNTLIVRGGEDDSVDLGGTWTKTGSETIGGVLYNVYTTGSATLKVACSVFVFTSTVDLSGVLNGTGSVGFTLFGADAGDNAGTVSDAGDVNGDGFPDLIIGAPAANNNAGETYVVFGKASWTATPTLSLGALTGVNGFTLTGIDAGDKSGTSASGAGDINGDGFDDLIIGAPEAAAASNAKAYAGESYVVFGKADWSATPTLSLGALTGGNGFTLFGGVTEDKSGFSVNSAGNVNGDGFDDFIIGAPNKNQATGMSYTVFGKANWSGTPTIDLGTLTGTSGFVLVGANASDQTGHSVAGAKDVNGDGFDDVIVGSSHNDNPANTARTHAGAIYVVFGKANWTSTPSINSSALSGSDGFTLLGVSNNDYSGRSVSSAGDVNGDGFDDMIVGGGTGTFATESYVVFGKGNWSGTSVLDLDLLDGTNGFYFSGFSSASVTGAGDVNSDSFDDLLIGNGFATEAGKSFLVYGKANWSGTVTLLHTALDGLNGFAISGVDSNDYSGKSVSSAGDINGDGFADFIIGAPSGDAAGNAKADAGESYVVFGGPSTSSVDFGDAPAPYPTLRAGDGARHIASGARLGVNVDGEADGQPSSTALGDDLNKSPDDEDGVIFLAPVMSLTATSSSSVQVNLTGATNAKLDGWIDFNQDGDWVDAGEQIFTSVTVANGNNILPFNVPANTVAGDTFARFRVSSAGGLTPTGLVCDGEVEDYKLTVAASSSPVQINLPNSGTSTLKLNGANVQLTQNNVVLAAIPLTAITELTIQGTTGNDTLIVDFSTGNPIPTSGLEFHGGVGGNDSLQMIGGNFADVTYNFTNANDGTIILDGSTIYYTGLEPISYSGTANNVIYNLTGGADDAVLEDNSPANDGSSIVRSANGTFESTSFTNPPDTIIINGGAGDDTITVGSLDSQFNSALTLNGVDGNDRLTAGNLGGVTLGGGAGDDTLIGVPGVDSMDGGGGSDTILSTANPSISSGNVSLAEGNAGTTAFVFQVTLSVATTQVVSMNYNTANGTATAGVDYTAASGTLTFASGETTKTITVLVSGDTLFETSKSFVVNLSAPVNGDLDNGTGTGTILNDDSEPTISIDDVTLAEGNSSTTSFSFAVTLSNASYQTITVNYTTADGTATAGSDYTAVSGTLTFSPGESNKTITVNANGDSTFETDETFTVNLNGATNASISDSQGVGTISNDDAQPTISINDVTLAEGNSGTTLFSFTVTLSNISFQTITVAYAAADSSATAADSDYAATSGTLTFSPGQTSHLVNISVSGDAKFEANETFAVNLSSPTNATIVDGSVAGGITNDDSQPGIAISGVTITEGDSGTTNAIFPVVLSNATDQIVTVNFTTADDSAVAGSDYNAGSGTITFSPNQTAQTISVGVLGNTAFESDKTFLVNLSGATNATITVANGSGIIANDDGVPLVSLSQSGSPLAEAGGIATVTATLSEASGVDVTVNLDFSGTGTNLSDYARSGTSILIPAASLSGSVTLTGVDDALDEASETVIVDITSVSNAAEMGGFQQVTVSITDDDLAPSVTLGLSGSPIVENGGVATVTASLSAVSGLDVTVDLGFSGTATAINDYSRSGTSIVISAGNLTGNVTLTGTDDALDEATETVIVDIANVTNGTEAGGLQQVTSNITDDDPSPSVALSLSGNPLSEAGGLATVMATLSAVSGQDVTVTLGFGGTATDLSDYTRSGTSILIAAGSLNGNITLTGLDDALDETNETVVVDITSVTNGTEAGGLQQVTASITDDDLPPTVSIAGASSLEGDSGTSNLLFTVSLSSESALAISVGFMTADGTATVGNNDYVNSAGDITFNPGQTSQTITIVISGEDSFEPDESFTVSISNPTNATLNVSSATGTITNDDNAPTVSVNNVSVTEGNSETVTANFNVTLSNPSFQIISVTYSTADGTATTSDNDYAAIGATALTFNPGETSKTITVSVNGNTIFESDETFTVNLSGATNSSLGSDTGIGTILNDDLPNGQLQFNSANFIVREDDGGVEISIARSGESFGQVTVDYSTSNGTATSGTDYPSTAGTLTFADGETSKTFIVPVYSDSLIEGSETFNLNLNAATGGASLGSPAVVTITDTTTSNGTAICDRISVILKGAGSTWVRCPGGVSPEEIHILGTVGTSSVTIIVSPGTGTPPAVGTIVVDGNIKSFNAPNVNLNGGGLIINGSVGSVVLGNLLSGADILITGNPIVPIKKMTTGAIDGDHDIITNSPIGSLTTPSIVNATIQAPSIGKFTVTVGPLLADINVTGAIKSITVPGGGAGGNWSAASFGKVSIIGGFSGSIRSTASTAILGTVAAVKSLNITGGNITGEIQALGNIAAFQIAADKLGNGGMVSNLAITAQAIGKLSIAGSATNLDASLTGALGGLSIGGSLSADSLFTAALFPSSVKIGGVSIDPLTDLRFDLI